MKIKILFFAICLLSSINNNADQYVPKVAKETGDARSMDELFIQLKDWFHSNIKLAQLNEFRQYLIWQRNAIEIAMLKKDLEAAARNDTTIDASLYQIPDSLVKLFEQRAQKAAESSKGLKKAVKKFNEMLNELRLQPLAQAFFMDKLAGYIFINYVIPAQADAIAKQEAAKKAMQGKSSMEADSDSDPKRHKGQQETNFLIGIANS